MNSVFKHTRKKYKARITQATLLNGRNREATRRREGTIILKVSRATERRPRFSLIYMQPNKL